MFYDPMTDCLFFACANLVACTPQCVKCYLLLSISHELRFGASRSNPQIARKVPYRVGQPDGASNRQSQASAPTQPGISRIIPLFVNPKRLCTLGQSRTPTPGAAHFEQAASSSPEHS